MAKVCMISVYHSPLDDRIFYKEALTLQRAGHAVSMICRSDENGVMYDMGGSKAINKPGEDKCTLEGVTTYAIKTPTTIIDKLLKKVLLGSFYKNYVSKAVEIDADIYHAHEPESFYLGLLITKQNGAKLVYDAHEAFSGGTLKERWLRFRYFSQIQYLVAMNDLYRRQYHSKNNNVKSVTIYNAAIQSLFAANVKAPEENLQKITFVHEGAILFNRGLKNMLEAFKRVNKRHPDTRLLFIGQAKGEEKEYIDAFVKTNYLKDVIKVSGWLDFDKVPEKLKCCSVGLIAFETSAFSFAGPPIKYFNYTAAGLAIIDLNMPETSRLINKYNNGVIVTNRTANALAEAMCTLVEDPSILASYQTNSVEAFKTLNWETEGEKLLKFYENTLLFKATK